MADTIMVRRGSSRADSDGVAYDDIGTPLEARAEIEPLETLHRERRQLLSEYAVLRALHGPNGKWDARRKAMLEAMKIRARMTLKAAGEKITDAAVDAVAHADEQYVQFIEDGITAATRYVVLDTTITEIEERIKSREASLYSYNAETRLGR